jgi:hypothetical protein
MIQNGDVWLDGQLAGFEKIYKNLLKNIYQYIKNTAM